MIKSREGVFKYIKDKYGTEPEYLWLRHPDYAIFRHGGNRKWYGAIVNIPRAKLGLGGEGEADLLNLKCDPEWAYVLRQEEGILPGYHMNKEHWISVILNGPVPYERICSLINASYELTKGK